MSVLPFIVCAAVLLWSPPSRAQETVDDPWGNEGAGCRVCPQYSERLSADHVRHILHTLHVIRNTCREHSRRIEQLEGKDVEVEKRLRVLEEDRAGERNTSMINSNKRYDNTISSNNVIIRQNTNTNNNNNNNINNFINTVGRKRSNKVLADDDVIIPEADLQLLRTNPVNSTKPSDTPYIHNRPTSIDNTMERNNSKDVISLTYHNTDINTQTQTEKQRTYPSAANHQLTTLSRRVKRIKSRERKKSATIKRMQEKMNRQDDVIQRVSRDVESLKMTYSEELGHVMDYVSHVTREAKTVHGVVEELVKTVKDLKQELKKVKKSCLQCGNT